MLGPRTTKYFVTGKENNQSLVVSYPAEFCSVLLLLVSEWINEGICDYWVYGVKWLKSCQK